jgi:DNA polymerase
VESKLHLDFETYSRVDLREVGVVNYVNHESTGIWCFSYAFGDDPVAVSTIVEDADEQSRQSLPHSSLDAIARHIHNGRQVVAHNAMFEFLVWNRVMCRYYPGLPPMSIDQMRCTRAKALKAGLPASLDDASRALGIDQRKDKTGTALMLKLCKPGKDGRLPGNHWPKFTCAKEQWTFAQAHKRLQEYCAQDTEVERELDKLLPDLPPRELDVFHADMWININGVSVDMDALDHLIRQADAAAKESVNDMKLVTCGVCEGPTDVRGLMRYLRQCGVKTDSVDKASVRRLLADPTRGENVRRALQIRQNAGKTSVAKLEKIKALAWRGRIFDMYQYHGAATGRWTSRGVQVQNLPRNAPSYEEYEELLKAETLDTPTISTMIRGLFVPRSDHIFCIYDYSQIEGRVTAWVCDQVDKVETFHKNDSHPDSPDIYQQTAGKLLNKHPKAVTSDERQAYGKVPELALGYGGGPKAFEIMAAVYGVKLSEEEIKKIVSDWRMANGFIRNAWYKLESAAIRAVENPGQLVEVLNKVLFKFNGRDLRMKLPSGRVMTYPFAELREGKFNKPELTYMKIIGEQDKGRIHQDMHAFGRWQRMGTWGGKLLENVVQALARDIMAAAIVNIEAELDYCTVVMHVHDELVLDSSYTDEKHKLMMARDVKEIMERTPRWAAAVLDLPALPVKVGPMNATMRYGK